MRKKKNPVCYSKAPCRACLPDVEKEVGLIVDFKKKNGSTLPVPFCASSAWCYYYKCCTPEFIQKFGCVSIDEATAKGKNPIVILTEKIRKEGGYDTQGPWFEALNRLSNGNLGAIEFSAWRIHIGKKFGARWRASLDL